MPRISSKPSKPRHDPLHVELQEADTYQKFGRVSKPGKRQSRRQDENEEGGAVRLPYGANSADSYQGEDARMSKKILDLAREQQEEIEGELDQDLEDDEEAEP